MSTPLTSYAQQERATLLAIARSASLAGDDCTAGHCLFMAAQIRAMIHDPHTLWVVGEQLDCDPRYAPPDEALERIGVEWTKGADNGPPEQCSSAARYRQHHPLPHAMCA